MWLERSLVQILEEVAITQRKLISLRAVVETGSIATANVNGLGVPKT